MRAESVGWRADRPATRTRSVAVFCAAVLAGVLLSVTVSSGRPILAARWYLLWQLAVWTAVFLVATGAAMRLPGRPALVLIGLAAVALRVAALAGPPTTSDDLYRYSWDGRVQASGVDPYRYPPAATQLSGLHERWLWPDGDGCARLRRPTGCTRINRPDARTIYPPVAEAWFAGVYRVAGIGARHKVWQVAGLLTDLATVGLLAIGLRRWSRDPRWAAFYALSPAPVLEFVNNAHVDGVAVMLVVAALVVAAPHRPGVRRRLPEGPAQDVALGLLVGAAALVKLYPAILLPALVGLPRPRPWLSAMRSAVAASLLAAVSYVPHVLAVGSHVLGYLPGYLREEHYNQGSRFLLAAAVGLHGAPAGLAAGGLVVAPVVWVAWRRPDACLGAAALMAALLLATTPVQPWYAVVLLALAAMAARQWWAAVVAAGYPYFFAVILDYQHAGGLGQVCYGSALAVVVVVRVSRHGLRAY